MRQIQFAVVALVVLLIGSSQTLAKPKPSIEYQLATINAGGYVKDDDISVARFRSLLGQLSSKYVNSRQEIGDMSVRAMQVLQEKGVRVKLMTLMEGLNRVIIGVVKNQKYEEYCALYITMRDQGYDHSETIESMQALVEALR